MAVETNLDLAMLMQGVERARNVEIIKYQLALRTKAAYEKAAELLTQFPNRVTPTLLFKNGTKEKVELRMREHIKNTITGVAIEQVDERLTPQQSLIYRITENFITRFDGTDAEGQIGLTDVTFIEAIVDHFANKFPS